MGQTCFHIPLSVRDGKSLSLHLKDIKYCVSADFKYLSFFDIKETNCFLPQYHPPFFPRLLTWLTQISKTNFLCLSKRQTSHGGENWNQNIQQEQGRGCFVYWGTTCCVIRFLGGHRVMVGLGNVQREKFTELVLDQFLQEKHCNLSSVELHRLAQADNPAWYC